jgi:hypothetical protein
MPLVSGSDILIVQQFWARMRRALNEECLISKTQPIVTLNEVRGLPRFARGFFGHFVPSE